MSCQAKKGMKSFNFSLRYSRDTEKSPDEEIRVP